LPEADGVTLLEQILDLTAAIEASVDAGDWPGAAALDGQRCGLLANLLAMQPRGQLEPAAREVFADLLRRNRATTSRVEHERQQLGTALRRLHESPAAMRAYERSAAPRSTATAGSDLT
jgi:hypothetical protein